jgi:hypothetical protein
MLMLSPLGIANFFPMLVIDKLYSPVMVSLSWCAMMYVFPQSTDFISKFCKFVQHLELPLQMKGQACAPQEHVNQPVRAFVVYTYGRHGRQTRV